MVQKEVDLPPPPAPPREEDGSTPPRVPLAPVVRADVRATRVGAGTFAWGDVSFASPLAKREAPRLGDDPLAAVAAVTREAVKVKKYGPALCERSASSEFTPLVWESSDRIGPATSTFFRDSFSSSDMRTVRATLLRDDSVALWKANALAGTEGYSICFPIAGVPAGVGVGTASVPRLFARIDE